MIATGPDLRLGDWREVLADVGEVDAVICDPPYGARTHEGHNVAIVHGAATNARKGAGRRQIGYAAWDDETIRAFVKAWAPRCRGWFVAMCDHQSAAAYAAALDACGFYTFAPLVWLAPGGRVRLAGDGPACWVCWIVVARPRGRRFMRWGSLPGAYVMTQGRGGHIGGKPLGLMRALVRDYSRRGDLVVDPCAGHGTTLIAAAIEGRHAIGAEIDAETYAAAAERLARGWTPTMVLEATTGTQGGLFDEGGR